VATSSTFQREPERLLAPVLSPGNTPLWDMLSRQKAFRIRGLQWFEDNAGTIQPQRLAAGARSLSAVAQALPDWTNRFGDLTQACRFALGSDPGEA
jgi:hypothetical protein